MIELKLPEWAFLDGYSHLGNQLNGRTVIIHVPSMTIIEIFEKNQILLNEGAIKISFRNTCTNEQLIAALHLSDTIESKSELKDLLKKCASWYCDYCDWEEF